MKKELQIPRYASHIYFLIPAFSLLFVLLVGFLGASFLHAQYMREFKGYCNIAGAILTEYPDVESTLLPAMQDTTYSNLNDGLAVLKKYGYHENLLMSDCIYYRSALGTFLSFLTLIFLVHLLLSAFFFIRLSQNRRKEENQIQALFEGYLAENYSVLSHSETFPPVFNDSFTDTLFKLGYKLMLKTYALAEERDHTKTLVTDISHQLKTPISALKSCFAMCMEADTETERTDFLKRCALQMEKLESLTASLIHISRLETSLVTLYSEKTILSDILMDAVNTIYEKALQKNISIEVSAPDDKSTSSLSLLLDKKWTAEAIANILDNAVKYSPAGGTITLRLHKLYSYVQIEIEDAGIGIPKTEYNQIFKRFYRGSHPTVKQTEGTGVGLYLSRKIIEEQGGTVTVKPAIKQGSIFVILLPL